MGNPNHQVCLHGHFYQPPRANPWLGVIERQASAHPHHNWNERITVECYEPNTCAPRYTDEGAIATMVNNFAGLSFNLGPTLYDWLAQEHPALAERIVEADQQVHAADGHGNAIAQAYGHAILPLANARDLRTQVRWGIRHFCSVFGRRPEGMWLPECGVDRRTIEVLIEAGIRFIILSPEQASRVRHFHDQHWREAYGSPLDTRHAYRIFARGPAGRKDYTRHIDVFFFDGVASQGFAFGGWMHCADGLADRLRDRLDQTAAWPQLASVATDGETFGHHQRNGATILAHLIDDLNSGVASLQTFARFLAGCPPLFEVELWDGEQGEGSSWSCKHGVDRWIRDCGCADGGPPEWSQAWRTPLRRALDQLRVRLDALFESAGARLLRDPWTARDHYIDVLIDPSFETREAFLQVHAPDLCPSGDGARHVWTLLEMQRHAMLMYASCGWFFADISGIEPVQNLRSARRAIERAAVLTDEDLEASFCTDLAAAKSNLPEEGTGLDVYRRHVCTTRYSPATIAACYALREACSLEAPSFHAWAGTLASQSAIGGWLQAQPAVLQLTDRPVQTTTVFATLASVRQDQRIRALVIPCPDEASARDRIAAWTGQDPAVLTAELDRIGIGLDVLPEEEREIIHQRAAHAARTEAEARLAATYDDLRPLLEAMRHNGLRPGGALQTAARAIVEEQICNCLLGGSGPEPGLTVRADAPLLVLSRAAEAETLLLEADSFGLAIDREGLAQRLTDRLRDALQRVAPPDLGECCEQARALLDLAGRTALPIQSRLLAPAYWQLMEQLVLPLAAACRAGSPSPGTPAAERADTAIRSAWALGRAIGFTEDHIDQHLCSSQPESPPAPQA